ncbi:MAG: Holliday junction resolvase Hjc [Nanoarchaeota archaeon]
MNQKAKGTNAERELIHMFWKSGWVAARVAGSGSMSYPSPDIIAAKYPRIIVIEAKVTSQTRQYIYKEDIKGLQMFASVMNAEPWIAVKFNQIGWYFIGSSRFDNIEKPFSLCAEDMKIRGLLFDEVLQDSGQGL